MICGLQISYSLELSVSRSCFQLELKGHHNEHCRYNKGFRKSTMMVSKNVIKGIVLPVQNCLNNEIFYRSLFSYWSLTFLFLSSKMIQIIIFLKIYLEYSLCVFKSALCAFRILREKHQHESFISLPTLAHFLLLLSHHHGGAKCSSMYIQNVSGVAQCLLTI